MEISVHNIEFSYNGAPVLKNVRCEIGTGDFMAVVGPNGSGKSTLIKCMNGILRPRKGTVYISSENIREKTLREIAKKMAYVPQNKAGDSPVSVFDSVLLGRKPYINWKPSQSDIDITTNVIARLKLDHIAMKDINKLSGGQQQNVFIARALAQQPGILLLDEPTSNLDLKHTVRIMDTLKNLCKQGLTVIVALHDINLAMRYASRIMMLKEGEIYACGGREIVTEERLERLYDIKVRLIKNNGCFHVIPESSIENQD